MRSNQAQRFTTITCFRNDFCPFHILYQGANTSAYEGMIIRKQNANRLHHKLFLLPRFLGDKGEVSGKLARIVVPRFGLDLISICPPASRTRSCIPDKPKLTPREARFCAVRTLNPIPSSRMISSSSELRCRNSTCACFAFACRTTLVSASWTIRKHIVSRLEGRYICNGLATNFTTNPDRCIWRSMYHRSVANSPRSSSIEGRKSSERSRTC